MHKNEENRFDAASNPSIVNCQLSIVHSPKGFTLVELLVVITIIGILSSLITVAVQGARVAAKRAKIAMEMGQITGALERYKSEYGEYPPDLYDWDSIRRHMRKRWPRFSFDTTNLTEENAFYLAINNVYRSPKKLTQLQNYGYTVSTATVFMGPVTAGGSNAAMYLSAVPFWVGGFPNVDGKFDGFSADPQAPFGRIYDSGNQDANGNDVVVGINNGGTNITSNADYYVAFGTQTKETLIDMEIGKNITFAQDSAGSLAYQCFVHQIRTDLLTPYVYFRGQSSGGLLAYYYSITSGSTTTYYPKQYDFAAVFGSSTYGIATPYAKSGDPYAQTSDASWFGPDSYQLIHPGLDGKFGNSTETGAVTHRGYLLDPQYFRSVKTDATKNNIGKDDFDNITNFSNGSELKTLTE